MNIFSIFLAAIIFFAQPFLLAVDDIHIDARVAAFNPSGKLMRQIYGDWQAVYEVEIGQFVCPCYEVWGNVSWLSTKGHTQALHTKTKFKNVNVSVGAKYLFCLTPCTQVYLGAGANGSFAHVHNYSPFVKRHVHKNGLGGVFKTGIYHMPKENLFVELFVDYLYQKIHFEHRVQIGGVKLGGGFGFSF